MEEKSINPQNIERVSKIKDNLEDAKSIILVDYKGLTVKEDTDLRRICRDNNINYFVCKNTLLKFATHDLHIQGIDEYLSGPTAVAISKENEIIPAKLIAGFAKELPEGKNLPKFKVGIIDNKLMNIEELNKLITLPSKQELLVKLLGGLNSPISGLVCALNSILQKLVIVLNEIKSQKQ